jgi:pimeloyl-ACP methyl ester carboxylesterase
MRAKLPSHDGFVERDGVKIHYEVYGDGRETMVFLPPWSIVHARVYKAQLPYFSERFRCITFDPRGNGKSDKPEQAAAYALDNHLGDVLSVMDATDAGKAIMVGLSLGGMHACMLAAQYPERVKAAVLAGTAATVGPGYPYLMPKHFTAKRERFDGWDKYNRDYWHVEYADFAEHFVRNICSDAHSTKQIEDGIEWAGDTTGPILAKTVEARTIPPTFDVGEAMYRKIKCPVLMIHGDNDQIQPYARAQVVAELTCAELFTIAGGGHNPLGRFPAKCNDLINDFLDRRLAIPSRSRSAQSLRPARRTRSISPRRSVWDTGAATSLSHGSCANCTPICKLSGWRKTPSPVYSMPAASASTHSARDWRASRGTSSSSRASTISTPFRPSAAWTRC